MKILATMIVISAALGVVGCGSKPGEEPGYTKKDFEKTAPPAGFINNAPKGPASQPPSGGR